MASPEQVTRRACRNAARLNKAMSHGFPVMVEMVDTPGEGFPGTVEGVVSRVEILESCGSVFTVGGTRTPLGKVRSVRRAA